MPKLSIIIPFAVLCLLGRCGRVTSDYTDAYNCTINSELESKLGSQPHERFNIIIELPSHREHVMDYPLVKELEDQFCARAQLIEKYLRDYADKDQEPFLDFLRENGEGHSTHALWIVNRIAVSGAQSDLIQKLGKIQSKVVCEIREQLTFKVTQDTYSDFTNTSYGGEYSYGNHTEEAQWGVRRIGSPLVWPTTRGRGIVVANIDSGVRADHEALRGNFGGRWFDAVDGTTTPNDPTGHGTHVMGTICGSTHGIGVAPEATWIACRAIDANEDASEVNVLQCGQWIFQERPHVVCNSWSGGQGVTIFNEVAANWRAVGIISTWSIGNTGPNCRTAESPGDQLNFWSVGNTDIADEVHFSSSRGPSAAGVQKPEISAPGTDIVSAGISATNSYRLMTGTSMAAPHVTGAVALMIAANPTLTEDQARTILQNTAARPSVALSDLACDRPPNGAEYPNAAYGFGRINVAAAMGI